MSKFLDHFPTVDYPGFGQVRDITPAIDIKGIEQTVPYQQPAGTRPDVIASKYYGDPVLEWVLFLANDIDNPRDLIYLTEDQFTDMINREYGSVEIATKKTKHYRHNWRDVTTSTLSAAEYDSLPNVVKPLFDTQRDFQGKVNGYRRKQTDFLRNTNTIYAVKVEDASIFTVGDPVTFESTSIENGRGEVTSIVGNTVYVSHIINSPTGTELSSGSQTAVVVSIDLQVENITAAEAAYYERISIYDYLYGINESRREIVVVDKRQTQQLERQLEQAFE